MGWQSPAFRILFAVPKDFPLFWSERLCRAVWGSRRLSSTE
jgi:hypothetical protein